jgi:hypothetical protein
LNFNQIGMTERRIKTIAVIVKGKVGPNTIPHLTADPRGRQGDDSQTGAEQTERHAAHFSLALLC